MLFAHGPLGALLSDRSIRMWWKGKITPRQKWILLLLGFIGGIFPDVDLLYYYLVDASTPHREFITHSFFIYVAVFVVLYFVAAVFVKKPVFKMAVMIFFIGVVSHLAVDSILAEVSWFFPFSRRLYGLSNFSALRPWLFSVNFALEFVFTGLFFLLLISFASWSLVRKRALIAVVAVGVVIASLGTFWFDGHNLVFDLNTPFLDMDGDGIANRADVDMDGDGLVNSRDFDADGNDTDNIDQLSQGPDFSNVWYDPTDGGLIEIPQRLGLPTTPFFIHHIYGGLGVPLAAEMQEDYALLAEGYEYPPSSSRFDNSVANIKTWLSHSGRLLPAEKLAHYQPGDIFFFGDGPDPDGGDGDGDGDAHAAIVRNISENGRVMMLEADRQLGVGLHTLDDIIRGEGEPVFIGRMLFPITNEDF